MMSNELVKGLVMLAKTVEEADEQIVMHLGLEKTEEKIQFLEEMFDIKIFLTENGESDEMIYYSMLLMIVREN